MSKSTFWSKIWKIAKPILTLGLSLAVSAIFKSNNATTVAIKEAVSDITEDLVDEVDTVINQTTDSIK